MQAQSEVNRVAVHTCPVSVLKKNPAVIRFGLNHTAIPPGVPPKIFSTQLAAALKEAQLGFKAALDAVRVCERANRRTVIALLFSLAQHCLAPRLHLTGRGARGGQATDGKGANGAGRRG